MVCAVHTNPLSFLNDTGSKYSRSLYREGGRGLGANGLNETDVAAGSLAPAGAGVGTGAGLLLVGLLAAGLLILLISRLLLLVRFGWVTLIGWGAGDPWSGRSLVVRGALQVADAGLEFIHDAKVVGVADYLRFGLVATAQDAGGLEVAGAKLAETNAGEVHGEGDREEGHGGSHRETRLQHGLAEGTEPGGDAGAEGKDVGGGVGKAAPAKAGEGTRVGRPRSVFGVTGAGVRR